MTASFTPTSLLTLKFVLRSILTLISLESFYTTFPLIYTLGAPKFGTRSGFFWTTSSKIPPLKIVGKLACGTDGVLIPSHKVPFLLRKTLKSRMLTFTTTRNPVLPAKWNTFVVLETFPAFSVVVPFSTLLLTIPISKISTASSEKIFQLTSET